MLNTPSGKNFFVIGGGFSFPVGAHLMGPVIPIPYVEEEGGTIFLLINSGIGFGAGGIPVLSVGPGQVLDTGGGGVLQTGPITTGLTLIFTRPDGTTFTRTSPDVYIGQVNLPQTFNGRPFAFTSNLYAVYTFAEGELNQGRVWKVGVLSSNGFITNQGAFFVRGFVLPLPGSIPVLSTGPGTVLSTGPGTVLQTGPPQ